MSLFLFHKKNLLSRVVGFVEEFRNASLRGYEIYSLGGFGITSPGGSKNTLLGGSKNTLLGGSENTLLGESNAHIVIRLSPKCVQSFADTTIFTDTAA